MTNDMNFSQAKFEGKPRGHTRLPGTRGAFQMWTPVRRSDIRRLPWCSAADDVYHTAIDVWSAGIILLFFLTRKFPLFQSNDDVEALMELSTILGRKGMERTATLHSTYSDFLGVLGVHLPP